MKSISLVTLLQELEKTLCLPEEVSGHIFPASFQHGKVFLGCSGKREHLPTAQHHVGSRKNSLSHIKTKCRLKSCSVFESTTSVLVPTCPHAGEDVLGLNCCDGRRKERSDCPVIPWTNSIAKPDLPYWHLSCPAAEDQWPQLQAGAMGANHHFKVLLICSPSKLHVEGRQEGQQEGRNYSGCLLTRLNGAETQARRCRPCLGTSETDQITEIATSAGSVDYKGPRSRTCTGIRRCQRSPPHARYNNILPSAAFLLRNPP